MIKLFPAEMLDLDQWARRNESAHVQVSKEEAEVIETLRGYEQRGDRIQAIVDFGINKKDRCQPRPITFQIADRYIALTFESFDERYGDYSRQQIANGVLQYRLNYNSFTYVQIMAYDEGDRGLGLECMYVVWPPLRQAFIDISDWIYNRVTDYCFFPPNNTDDSTEESATPKIIKLDVFPPPPTSPEIPRGQELVKVRTLSNILGMTPHAPPEADTPQILTNMGIWQQGTSQNKGGRPSYVEDEWATDELERGRPRDEVVKDWLEKTRASRRKFADPQESFDKQIKAVKKRREKTARTE
jgi:hypothetical protein